MCKGPGAEEHQAVARVHSNQAPSLRRSPEPQDDGDRLRAASQVLVSSTPYSLGPLFQFRIQEDNRLPIEDIMFSTVSFPAQPLASIRGQYLRDELQHTTENFFWCLSTLKVFCVF